MTIIFEGNDGVGKTTVINHLGERLSKMGKVFFIKTPDEFFTEMRKFINEQSDAELSLKFYTMCNLYASLLIKANESKYRYILVDRFFYSTIVSHTYLGVKIKKHWSKLFTKPDLCILLNVDNITRSERIAKRGKISPHDALSLNHTVEKISNQIYSSFNFAAIDNSGTIEKTIDCILELINNHEKNGQNS